MKRIGITVVLAFAVRCGAFAYDQVNCVPASPALHVAVFDANGTLFAPNASDRISAMATTLPQTAQQQNLDVMCLTELWDPQLRATALQGFTAPAWNVYQPAPADQTGCQNACYANRTVVVQSCANTVLPQVGFPCLYLPGTDP